jgi:uncharacterized membrane protein YraQ (UPF0718 family)
MAPVMVFLISSPLMSPSAFFVTLGGLGWSIAVWKLVTAVVLGLTAGWITAYLSKKGYLGRSILRLDNNLQEADETVSSSPSESAIDDTWSRRISKEEVMTFLRLTGKFSIFIGKFIIIAVIAQSIMVHFVPQRWISAAVGMQNSYSVLISTIVGIPAYLSSISAVPLLRGLMDLGMDKGAVLAFIIAGPIMSVPSILAVMALFKRRALYVYLSVGFLGAVVFGYTYRLF